MPPEHDAWWITSEGTVHKIVVRTTGDRGVYHHPETGRSLRTAWTDWGFDRAAVYREAIRRSEAKADQLKKSLAAARNFADRLDRTIRDLEQGQ